MIEYVKGMRLTSQGRYSLDNSKIILNGYNLNVNDFNMYNMTTCTISSVILKGSSDFEFIIILTTVHRQLTQD